MLGWMITVHRCGSREVRKTGGDAEAPKPVPESTDRDEPIARWQAGLGGTGWLGQLVTEGRALSTRRGGYPDTYLIRFRDFAARLEDGLPHENGTWVAGEGDILTDRFLGRTTIDEKLLAKCDPDEWVLVEVWDES